MGVAIPHALGRSQRVYVIAETTYGTMVKATAASAVKVLSCSIKGKIPYQVREDARNTRSAMERFRSGVEEVTWEMETYANATGTPGGEELKAMLTHALGSFSGTTYSLTDTQGVHGSLSIHQEMDTSVLTSACGAVCNTVKISQTAGEPVKYAFSGFASKWKRTGRSTLGAECTSGATTATIQAVDANAFEGEASSLGGSVIQIGTDTNSSTGYLVTGVSGSVVTFTPAIGVTQASGLAVAPFVPTETGVDGSPISGTLGSFVIAGTGALDYTTASGGFPITAWEWELDNGMKHHTDVSFVTQSPDYNEGFRTVKGSITVRARRDLIRILGDSKALADATAGAFTITCGNSASTGRHFIVSGASVRHDDTQMEVPQSEEALIKIPFVCLGSSSGANEATIQWP